MMPRLVAVRRGLALLLAAMLLALLSAACDGGGDGPAPDGQTPQPTVPPQASPTTTPGRTPTPAPTPRPGAGLLEQLAAAYLSGVDGKVVYDYVTENFGEHPQGVWGVYRLSGDLRKDWTTTAFGFEATTVVILAGQDAFVCTKAPALISCYRETQENASSLLVLFTPITEVPEAIVGGAEGLQSTPLPDETIAGVTGKCFQINVAGRIGTGPAGTEEMKVCFDEDGQLLLLDRRIVFDDPSYPEATQTLTATEMAAATAADFEPLQPVE